MTDIGNQAAPWMDIEEFTLAARGMVFSGLACGPKEGETVLLLVMSQKFLLFLRPVMITACHCGR